MNYLEIKKLMDERVELTKEWYAEKVYCYLNGAHTRRTNLKLGRLPNETRKTQGYRARAKS